jgi:hypothetical protein
VHVPQLSLDLRENARYPLWERQSLFVVRSEAMQVGDEHFHDRVRRLRQPTRGGLEQSRMPLLNCSEEPHFQHVLTQVAEGVQLPARSFLRRQERTSSLKPHDVISER